MMRCNVKPIPVGLKGYDPFSVQAVERYETELLKAQSLGTKIRMLILCNPHNPLGQYLLSVSISLTLPGVILVKPLKPSWGSVKNIQFIFSRMSYTP
jgi:hypothetical protein